MVVMAIRVAPAATDTGAHVAARMTALPGTEPSSSDAWPWILLADECNMLV